MAVEIKSRPVRTEAEQKQRAKAVLDLEQKRKFDIATNEKQRELWHALNNYISRHGGFLISPPAEKYLRVEIPQYSALADGLHDLGYDLREAGTGERIVGGKFLPTRIFRFQIPLPR